MHPCKEFPSDELLLAIAQFNRCDWFECHETLEELWMGEHGEMRSFYQGILQISVAMHHWANGNFEGAIALLKSGADYLRNVRSVCRQIDVTGFVAAADSFRKALDGLGKERMAELDPSLMPPIQTVPVEIDKD